jgi:IS5 family transposase
VDKDNPDIKIKHRGKDKKLTDKECALLKRSRAIEPIIGHLKADHRMDRCHLKGSDGDAACGAVLGGLQHPLAAADDRQERPRPFVVPVAGSRFATLAGIIGRNRMQNSDQRWALA